jgi:hypothetical protein
MDDREIVVAFRRWVAPALVALVLGPEHEYRLPEPDDAELAHLRELEPAAGVQFVQRRVLHAAMLAIHDLFGVEAADDPLAPSAGLPRLALATVDLGVRRWYPDPRPPVPCETTATRLRHLTLAWPGARPCVRGRDCLVGRIRMADTLEEYPCGRDAEHPPLGRWRPIELELDAAGGDDGDDGPCLLCLTQRLPAMMLEPAFVPPFCNEDTRVWAPEFLDRFPDGRVYVKLALDQLRVASYQTGGKTVWYVDERALYFHRVPAERPPPGPGVSLGALVYELLRQKPGVSAAEAARATDPVLVRLLPPHNETDAAALLRWRVDLLGQALCTVNAHSAVATARHLGAWYDMNHEALRAVVDDGIAPLYDKRRLAPDAVTDPPDPARWLVAYGRQVVERLVRGDDDLAGVRALRVLTSGHTATSTAMWPPETLPEVRQLLRAVALRRNPNHGPPLRDAFDNVGDTLRAAANVPRNCAPVVWRADVVWVAAAALEAVEACGDLRAADAVAPVAQQLQKCPPLGTTPSEVTAHCFMFNRVTAGWPPVSRADAAAEDDQAKFTPADAAAMRMFALSRCVPTPLMPAGWLTPGRRAAWRAWRRLAITQRPRRPIGDRPPLGRCALPVCAACVRIVRDDMDADKPAPARRQKRTFVLVNTTTRLGFCRLCQSQNTVFFVDTARFTVAGVGLCDGCDTVTRLWLGNRCQACAETTETATATTSDWCVLGHPMTAWVRAQAGTRTDVILADGSRHSVCSACAHALPCLADPRLSRRPTLAALTQP